MMSLELQIQHEARALGFIAAGFAAAGPSHCHEHFCQWLERGCQADMDFLVRQVALRADPHRLAAQVRSIIVVAMRYPRHPQPGIGFCSLSQHNDYHLVVRHKLALLAERIRALHPLTVARICVDSAPLPEREWALRAGLGWAGRQGQLVRTDSGCCLVLGELLVDLDLTPSRPAVKRCGRCRRCLDACPTQAIQADGTMDARRCISYWTIEHKASIPVERRPTLGAALFGCDRCTAVCPWNRFGNHRVPAEFALRPAPSPAECLAMDTREFNRRFAGTTVERTGLERLQRNAAIALGNSAAPAAVPVLQLALDRLTSPLVREHLAWALHRLQP